MESRLIKQENANLINIIKYKVLFPGINSFKPYN